MVQIYKEKGDIQDCKNYTGIKLMSHTMKLYERIIERRVRGETLVGDEQFGFMPGRCNLCAKGTVGEVWRKTKRVTPYLH